MFVIGRQGDQVELLFPTTNLSAPAPGMVRDYFLIVACWFKDPPGTMGLRIYFHCESLAFHGYERLSLSCD